MQPFPSAGFPSQFRGLAGGQQVPSSLRTSITAAYRLSEQDAVQRLLADARMGDETGKAANELALQIARRLRERKNSAGRAGLVQGLLQEYALSSQEAYRFC
ncbi:hypothetical protein ABL850_09315 [Variovorax paradoxus]|jgi:RHH-type proline utilization regulon transcriptional repressor/proline dehydrogenase/delta 1-pyrroline-5-carboxylate dehydrogenase|uniref:hypothetical protein n=1 Tax=Variovorax paradoxus TaxID=34073 RepID=UPI00040713FA